MRTIAKFAYGKNVYALVYDNKKFRAGKINGGKISFKLTHEEYDLFKKVLISMMPGDARYISKASVENREYNVYYDNGNKLFLFDGAKGKDLAYLNNMFNHQSAIVASEKSDSKLKRFIKRMVNVGKKAVSVMVLSSLSFSIVPTALADVEGQELEFDNGISIEDVMIDEDKIVYVDDTEYVMDVDGPIDEFEEIFEDLKPEDVLVKSDQDYEIIDVWLDNKDIPEDYIMSTFNVSQEWLDNYKASRNEAKMIVQQLQEKDVTSVGDLNDTIRNNPYLLQNEKNALLECTHVIDDNLEYLDLDYLNDSFANLKIKKYEDKKQGIAGEYYWDLSSIYLYDNRQVGSTNNVFTHEFCHSLRKDNYSTNTMLVEGSNVIFNNEYFGDKENNLKYDYTYEKEVGITKMLAEIIGADKIKEYHSTLDDKLIENALMEIIDDKEMVDNLVGNMKFYMNNVTYEFENITVDSNEILSNIYNSLGAYYEAKYGMSMDNDLIMLEHYDYDKFLDEVSMMYGLDKDKTLVVQDKCYLNSDLVDNYKNIEVVDYSRAEYTRYMTFEEALKLGYITSNHSSFYCPSSAKVENGLYSFAKLDECNRWVIDDNNRYIEKGMAR